MTIASQTSKNVYVGNGSTTIASYTFPILQDSDLLVSVFDPDTGAEDVLTLNVDYTVSGAGNEFGGNVTFAVAPADGATVLILRSLPYTQPTDYKNEGAFFPRAHERSFDRATMQIQQIKERVDAALTLPAQVTGVSTVLPNPEPGSVLGWQSPDSDAIINIPAGSLASVAAFTDWQIVQIEGDGVTSLFGLPTFVSNPKAMFVDIDGVVQQFGTDYAIDIGSGGIGFSETPASGAKIQIKYGVALPDQPDAGVIDYTAPAAGAVARRAAARLGETLMAGDFGATGAGVSNEHVQLQAALDASAGGTLVLGRGKTFLLGAALKVKAGTTIDARGATILRNGALDNILRNDGDGVTGGYGQAGGITIIGGTIDARSSLFPSACTPIAFGHCTDIRIIDVTVLNVPVWHHVEFNGVRRGWIERCRFSGGAPLDNQEAVQIDLNAGGGQFPWFGPADSTPCDEIKISGCTFDNVGSGVGSHTAVAGVVHTDIVVERCTFKDIYFRGVNCLNYSGVTITENRFIRNYQSIAVHMATTVRDYVITNNRIVDVGVDGTRPIDGNYARAIFIDGASASVQHAENVVIKGNVIRNCPEPRATHAIAANYAENVVCSDNVIRDVWHAGIYAFGGADWTVNGNSLINCNISGARQQIIIGRGATVLNRATVVGNTISGGGSGSIDVNNVDRALVTDNNCTFGSISTTSVTNSSIAGNLLNGVLV